MEEARWILEGAVLAALTWMIVRRLRSRAGRLPTGTPTLLFTDIEGSTHLLQRLGDGYRDVLTEHHRRLRSAFATHGGTEVSVEGDGFFVAFPSPEDAVAAALTGQRLLDETPWPHPVSVKVRMGIHTGPVQTCADGYVGLAVHQAARICSEARGGQVLASGETLKGLTVLTRDLGSRELRNLDQPIRLHEVVHPGSPVTVDTATVRPGRTRPVLVAV